MTFFRSHKNNILYKERETWDSSSFKKKKSSVKKKKLGIQEI